MPHPLHSLFKLLPQTMRSVSNKYHTEIPKTLLLGGEAKIEVTVRWYVLNHEWQADDNSWAHSVWIVSLSSVAKQNSINYYSYRPTVWITGVTLSTFLHEPRAAFRPTIWICAASGISSSKISRSA